jgi:hypothetical protein
MHLLMRREDPASQRRSSYQQRIRERAAAVRAQMPFSH